MVTFPVFTTSSPTAHEIITYPIPQTLQQNVNFKFPRLRVSQEVPLSPRSSWQKTGPFLQG